MFKFIASSKPRSSRIAPTDSHLLPPHYAYESFSSDGIPRIRVKSQSQPSYSSPARSSKSSRKRTVSFSQLPQSQKVDAYPAAAVGYHHYPTYKMQSAGYSPQMAYAVPQQQQQAGGYYYGTGGQVVYAPVATPMKVRGGMPNDSPLSQHREDLSRGRPRSHSVLDKVVLTSGSAAEAVRVPLVAHAHGHGPGSSVSSHEDRPNKRLFGSFMSNLRSRSKSKSRERDSIIPSSRSSHDDRDRDSRDSRDSRGRRYEREMRHDEASEIARRMEKDLRLSDFEDPYRPIRRDRSLSQDSTQSSRSNNNLDRDRERMQRRFRDISPDVQDNTMYNARFLKYNGSPVMPVHPAASSGYHTDVQPRMMSRRSSTSAAIPLVTKSRPIATSHLSASHISSSERSQPTGWFNRRGDELVRPGTIIRQPPEREYPSHLKRHPDVGAGFMDSKGNVIDANCRLIKRVG